MFNLLKLLKIHSVHFFKLRHCLKMEISSSLGKIWQNVKNSHSFIYPTLWALCGSWEITPLEAWNEVNWGNHFSPFPSSCGSIPLRYHSAQGARKKKKGILYINDQFVYNCQHAYPNASSSMRVDTVFLFLFSRAFKKLCYLNIVAW